MTNERFFYEMGKYDAVKEEKYNRVLLVIIGIIFGFIFGIAFF